MRHCYLILVFLLAAVSAQTQQYPFLKWSVSDGLAQSQVRCIYQDHIGYLWVGTLGGVSRFNGREFKSFSRRDGLLSNQINTIIEVGDSLLVFASIGGLTLYDGHKFTAVRFPDQFASAQVNHLFNDTINDRLLIGTELGLLQFKDEIEVILGLENEVPYHIKRIVDSGEQLLLVTRSEVIRTNRSFSFLMNEVTKEDIGAIVLDGIEDGHGGLLLATVGKGLMHLSRSGIKSYSVDDGMISDNITGIVSGYRPDEFWVKSRDGFSSFILPQGREASEIYSYGQPEGLDNTDVRAICVDREQNVWLGTYGGGIRKFTGRGVMHYTTASGMSGDIVMTVQADANGDFWFGTYDNGITQMRSGELTRYGIDDGLNSSRVWSSFQDDDGFLWFGTSGGLSVFDGKSFQSYTTADGLPHNQVLSIRDAGDGQVYVGTARGLAVLDLNDRMIRLVERAGDLRVRSIVTGDDNSLWLATNAGVYGLQEEAVISVDESTGLPDNSVFCMTKAPDGKIWAGTESGIGIIQPNGEVSTLFLEGGFGANHVNFISFPENGAIWVGTNDGVFYAPDFAASTLKWTRLGRHDGVTFLETNQNAVWVGDDEVWVGTSGALTRIDRSVVEQSRDLKRVKVHIDQVRVNLLDTDFSAYGYEHRGYGGMPLELVVPYTDNHFSFNVDALSLRDPENLRYQYYLEGADDDWEPVTESGFATYSQLPFGQYVFKVRAVDGIGEVTDYAGFSFEIRPPIYLRWWFILIEVVIAVLIIMLVFRQRQRAFMVKIEREQLEFKSRMLALEQQTLNSSMNRHFIFNSLNAIQYYINRQDRLSANRYLSSFAKLIRKNLDSSQVNYSTLHDEVERLELYLQLEHMRFTDRFEYEIVLDDAIDAHTVKVPSMLLQPFLENSIWHGLLPKESIGKVKVAIVLEGDQAMKVSILDDGIGIETSLQNKSDNGDHISQGMTITSGRIDLLRQMTGKRFEIVGPYQLVTADGEVEGTQVDIFLPLDL